MQTSGRRRCAFDANDITQRIRNTVHDDLELTLAVHPVADLDRAGRAVVHRGLGAGGDVAPAGRQGRHLRPFLELRPGAYVRRREFHRLTLRGSTVSAVLETDVLGEPWVARFRNAEALPLEPRQLVGAEHVGHNHEPVRVEPLEQAYPRRGRAGLVGSRRLVS